MNDEDYTVKDNEQWDSAVNSLCGEHSISIDMSAGPDYTAIATAHSTPTSDMIRMSNKLKEIYKGNGVGTTDSVAELVRRISTGRLFAVPLKYQAMLDILKDDRVQRLLLALEHEATNPEYLSMYVDWLTEQLRLPSGLDEPITDEWLAECCAYGGVFGIYDFGFGRLPGDGLSFDRGVSFYKESSRWACGFQGVQLLDQGEITTRRHVVNLCEALLMKPWPEIVAHNRQHGEQK